MTIIGITGTLGSGKGTVVDYLVSRFGFQHYSSSDFISEEIARRGLPDNRDSMHTVGNALRAEHGPGYVVKQLFDRAQLNDQPAVIESLRSIGEVKTLREQSESFFLLAIDADPKIRYDRITKRKSSKDNVSFEKFLADEGKEMHDTSSHGMNIAACMKLADATITNNGNLVELHRQIDQLMKKLL